MSIQNGNEKTKILIVDSNPENIAQLTEILSPVYTIITASPEKNEYPMISQSTEITISTIIKKQDDEVIVHYGWSNDKNIEPTNYRPLTDYTTISERKELYNSETTTKNNTENTNQVKNKEKIIFRNRDKKFRYNIIIIRKIS